MANFMKKSVCCMLVIVLMLSSLSLIAFANGESKTVTYDKSYTFVMDSSQVSNYLRSPSNYVPTSYKYDDGTYKGTLKLTIAKTNAPTIINSSYGITFRVTIYTRYSGTVTSRMTKTVTRKRSYTFVMDSSQVSNYLRSPSNYVPTSYKYDDGTYKGTLKLTSAKTYAPTIINNSYGITFRVTIYANYSGTVMEK